uniref:Uncharacterized protein n=1 Tax=Sphaerodactylus townsendi TaxID=933632 RepID=A0ACB8ECR1_9SAUR
MNCVNDINKSHFNYGSEDYDAEGNEEPKVLPSGPETMPYIDESPTMSPQLSTRAQEGNGDGNEGVTPTAPDEPDIVVSGGRTTPVESWTSTENV